MGGYALIDVDDPKAFEQYQLYHTNNYIHVARITFEPLADLDAAVAAQCHAMPPPLAARGASDRR